ncbi:MAG: hypothetical protein RBU29_15855, partial [bacterium]|nr:hypothetical protein [bacterium]
MKLTLDGQAIDVVEESDSSLSLVIERISHMLKERFRVVSELEVDGVAVGDWSDPAFQAQTVGQTQEIRIRSEEPRKLAVKVLYEIATYMPKIQDALIKTSEKIQSRKEEEGMRLLEQVTSTWAELLHGLQSAILVTGIDLQAIQVKEKTFLDINNEIHQFLEEISRFVQDQQYLELSDILEYELAPRLPELEEGIYQIIKSVEQAIH